MHGMSCGDGGSLGVSHFLALTTGLAARAIAYSAPRSEHEVRLFRLLHRCLYPTDEWRAKRLQFSLDFSIELDSADIERACLWIRRAESDVRLTTRDPTPKNSSAECDRRCAACSLPHNGTRRARARGAVSNCVRSSQASSKRLATASVRPPNDALDSADICRVWKTRAPCSGRVHFGASPTLAEANVSVPSNSAHSAATPRFIRADTPLPSNRSAHLAARLGFIRADLSVPGNSAHLAARLGFIRADLTVPGNSAHLAATPLFFS